MIPESDRIIDPPGKWTETHCPEGHPRWKCEQWVSGGANRKKRRRCRIRANEEWFERKTARPPSRPHPLDRRLPTHKKVDVLLVCGHTATYRSGTFQTNEPLWCFRGHGWQDQVRRAQ